MRSFINTQSLVFEDGEGSPSEAMSKHINLTAFATNPMTAELLCAGKKGELESNGRQSHLKGNEGA